MPDKRPSVKNEKQYEALRDKGMSKQRRPRLPEAHRHLARRVAPPVGEEATIQAVGGECRLDEIPANRTSEPSEPGVDGWM